LAARRAAADTLVPRKGRTGFAAQWRSGCIALHP